VKDRLDSGLPDRDQIAELQARADAGDRNAAGRLGELLAEQGDLEGAVRAWQFSDVIWQNPAGLRAEFLSGLSPEERLERDDEPEDWAFMESQEVARLLAERDDGQRRYVASWAEHKFPGSLGRSATWGPKLFEQAKAALIGELRRNLSTWAGWDGSDSVRYSKALDTLKTASGPVTIDLPRHILTITEAPSRA
jgi:hypothetical protein